MDECEDNSLPCSSDKKRGWDLFNNHLNCNQPAAENKRTCTEWPPSLEAKPNLDFSFSSFSSPECPDRQVYSPRAANISLRNELGFFCPSTTYRFNPLEETDRIGPPASCLTDLSWSASNTIPSEVVLDQNSGNAVAAAYPAASAYSINQEQLGIPSGTFVGAHWPRYEVQIATQQTLAQHYQNETSFSSRTLTYSSISIQDFPACPFSASGSSLIPPTWVSQSSLGSTSPTQPVEFQDKSILHELSGNGLDYRESFAESSGSYPSSDLQDVSQQCTSAQDASGFRSFNLALDDTESSDLVDYLNTSSEPKQLCSSQTALVSEFPEEPYDTCFGMASD
jgi:hypothetical protein